MSKPEFVGKNHGVVQFGNWSASVEGNPVKPFVFGFVRIRSFFGKRGDYLKVDGVVYRYARFGFWRRA